MLCGSGYSVQEQEGVPLEAIEKMEEANRLGVQFCPATSNLIELRKELKMLTIAIKL